MKKTVMGTNLHGKTLEINVSDLSLRVSVYGVLIEEKKVLMATLMGGYDLPGGGLNIGETFEECLIREFREETGITISVGTVIDSKMSFFYHPHVGNVQSILIYMGCTKVSGELTDKYLDTVELEYGGGMPEWISLNDLDSTKLFHSVDSKPIIRKAAALL